MPDLLRYSYQFKNEREEKKMSRNYGKLAMSAILAGAAMLMAGCGSKSSGSDTSFTFWLYKGVDSQYYSDYSKNPALEYAVKQNEEKTGKKRDFEFWVPAGGSSQESFQTMIGSGDYADVFDGSISSGAMELYEDGVILDLTDYVNDYMPNYKALLDANPEIKNGVTFNIDGEERILSVTGMCDDYDSNWYGYMYRRDWLVKYGTNPQTGAAFTGGYTDENDLDSWEDDVVFPSGGTDPVYLSDWEWMFDIFAKAQADQGITDSYELSVYYPGYLGIGMLESSFGTPCPFWYVDENKDAALGLTTAGMKAYMECLNSWYEKGWLDPEFSERTSDSFYSIDDTSVRQGKVGMWLGLVSEFGRRLDVGDEWTTGICVYGCAAPINDIYGDESCQNKIPQCVASTDLKGQDFYVSTAAEDKDLEALFTFLDYFYTEEGALLKTLGLNDEQVKEVDSTLYSDYGLENGYTVNADGKYVQNPIIANDGSGLEGAAVVGQLPGLTLVKNVDNGYTGVYAKGIEQWSLYEDTATVPQSVRVHMSTDDSNEITTISNKLKDYTALTVPKFIKGEMSVDNDADWAEWCKMVEKYNTARVTEIYQTYFDEYLK